MKNPSNSRGTYGINKQYMQPQYILTRFFLSTADNNLNQPSSSFLPILKPSLTWDDVYTGPTSEVKPPPCKDVK